MRRPAKPASLRRRLALLAALVCVAGCGSSAGGASGGNAGGAATLGFQAHPQAVQPTVGSSAQSYVA